MRVFVTGGLGFVGHAVCRQLVEDGHDVTILTSRPGARSLIEGVHTVEADIRDRAGLARHLAAVRPEGVCHLAALARVRDSFSSPLEYHDVNVGGTIALLQALDEHKLAVPVVFASTGAVYGRCEGRIREDQPALAPNPYGASKLAAEDVLAYHAATGAIGAVSLRCFNIAGAVGGQGDSDTSHIIPKALQVAAGEATHVEINGDGTAVRDFTHVADVATAFALALETAQPGGEVTYNLSAGIDATMLDIISTVRDITGQPVPIKHQPPKDEPVVLTAKSKRIRDELGWQPTHTLTTMVRDAWSAFQDPDAITGRQ